MIPITKAMQAITAAMARAKTTSHRAAKRKYGADTGTKTRKPPHPEFCHNHRVRLLKYKMIAAMRLIIPMEINIGPNPISKDASWRKPIAPGNTKGI